MPKGRAVMPKYARADRARLFKIEHLARVVLARNTRRARRAFTLARSPQQNPHQKPYVATEESQERHPEKPVVELHAAKRPPSASSGWGGFATSTAET
jgi:hypothetical protein